MVSKKVTTTLRWEDHPLLLRISASLHVAQQDLALYYRSLCGLRERGLNPPRRLTNYGRRLEDSYCAVAAAWRTEHAASLARGDKPVDGTAEEMASASSVLHGMVHPGHAVPAILLPAG